MRYGLALLALISVGLDLPADAATTASPTPTAPSAQPQGPDLSAPVSLLPPAPKSWALECMGRPAVHYGPLTLDDTTWIDPTRCIRLVSDHAGGPGNLLILAGTPPVAFDGFHQLGRPYLEEVDGDLTIVSNGRIDEIYLPRLRRVSGTLTLDLFNMMEYVGAPQLTALSQLVVHLRPMANDLTGLNALTQVGRLELSNQTGTQVIDLDGLTGITALDSFSISGAGIYDPTQPVDEDQVLTALTQVKGNLSIAGNGLVRLYGLEALQSVGGDLAISEQLMLESLVGLGKLQSVGGSLRLDEIVGLTNVDGLGTLTVGELQVTDNPDLVDLSGLAGLSVTAGGSARFGNNAALPCAELDAFEAQHPGLTVVREPGACI